MIAENEHGVFLAVKVTPNASKNQISGIEGDALKIKIAAAPEKGEANEELIRFVAKWLGIAKSNIQLIQGATSRHKRLFIKGLKELDITNKLEKQYSFEWNKK